MKLNASKTKMMIAFRSHTAHPQSPPLTIGGTLLKESDDLVRYEMTLASKMTFERHLRSVSRTVSQRLGILKMSWLLFRDRSLLWEILLMVCPARFGVLFCSVVLGCRGTH